MKRGGEVFFFWWLTLLKSFLLPAGLAGASCAANGIGFVRRGSGCGIGSFCSRCGGVWLLGLAGLEGGYRPGECLNCGGLVVDSLTEVDNLFVGEANGLSEVHVVLAHSPDDELDCYVDLRDHVADVGGVECDSAEGHSLGIGSDAAVVVGSAVEGELLAGRSTVSLGSSSDWLGSLGCEEEGSSPISSFSSGSPMGMWVAGVGVAVLALKESPGPSLAFAGTIVQNGPPSSHGLGKVS